MSIEKFKGSFSNEAEGCTVVINETIQSINDFALTGLYTYLLTKPSTWQPNHKELMSQGKCSKTKVYKLLNQLLTLNLMSVTSIREKGRFVRNHYTVHLKPISPFPKNWEMVTNQDKSTLPPFPKNWEMVENKDLPVNTNVPFPKKPDMVFWETQKTKKEKNKETTTTTTDHIPEIPLSGYFTEDEIKDLILCSGGNEGLSSLSEKEVVVVFEGHCRENEEKKGWNKPKCIAGIKSILQKGAFHVSKKLISKSQNSKLNLTDEQKDLISKYKHFKKYPQIISGLSDLEKKEAERLIELLEATQNMRNV